jgi:DNA ligase-1
MAKTFGKLFKKATTGAIQEWQISVDGNVITTVYGQVGGAMQTATDVVTKGKNTGKKNATTPETQALADAQSKWEKQLKKGYVETLEAAEAGDRHAIIEGGIDPMLAQKYRDHAKKIQWPAYVQPKLDGIRCIAMIQDGEVTLWSRTRKLITGVPHINAFLAERFAGQTLILDGELYNHDYKSDFEKITSIVRQETPIQGHEVVQYHVYDTIQEGLESFDARAFWILGNIGGGPLVAVPTHLMQNEDDMLEYFSICLSEGYEGCMVRNRKSVYENKRSYSLQKVKEMQDEEFEIVGVEEGRGKMAGKAIFNCKAKNGDTFAVKMKGRLDNLVQYVKDPSLAVGKLLTVQFQNLTTYGIPRFPVGKAIRDYE